MVNHWKTKDKQWVAERKQLWEQLRNTVKRHYPGGFNRHELKNIERYFLSGKRTDEIDYEYPSIFLDIAWHPSQDENDWLAALREHESYYGKVHFGNIFSNYSTICTSSSDDEPSMFLNRERQLCHFFFANEQAKTFFETHQGCCRKEGRQSSNQGAYYVRKMRDEMFRSVETMLSYFKSECTSDSSKYLYHGLVRHSIPFLAERYTTEFYQELVNKKDWKRWLIRLKMFARLHVCLDQYPLEQQEIIQEWVAQIEQSAPEWREAWFQLKHQEAQTYTPKLKSEAVKEEDAKLSDLKTDSTTNSSKRTAWPEPYASLKEKLIAQGFAMQQEAEPDLHSMLEAFFPDKSILFGLFTDDFFTVEDLEEPFEAFVYPLEKLCELSGSHQMSYQQRGDYLQLKADGKRVGKIYLEDPLEEGDGKEGVGHYFKEVVQLAHSWFPDQVYCHGEDEFVLFILPEPVVQLLADLGFQSKPDYFGGAGAASADFPLAGLSIVFTGTFSAGSRDDIEDQAEMLGAKVQSSVNSKTDYLVCGSKVGASKLAKAEALGVKVLSEAEYQAMISQSE